ncbi:MAG: hypothetical protein EZS28_041300, partial [Streblomastix strix]
IPASNEIRIQLYDKKPYPSLLRLRILNHPNSLVINDAIVSILHILLAGASITEITTADLHFDIIIQCIRIEKIFENEIEMRNYKLSEDYWQYHLCDRKSKDNIDGLIEEDELNELEEESNFESQYDNDDEEDYEFEEEEEEDYNDGI